MKLAPWYFHLNMPPNSTLREPYPSNSTFFFLLDYAFRATETGGAQQYWTGITTSLLGAMEGNAVAQPPRLAPVSGVLNQVIRSSEFLTMFTSLPWYFLCFSSFLFTSLFPIFSFLHEFLEVSFWWTRFYDVPVVVLGVCACVGFVSLFITVSGIRIQTLFDSIIFLELPYVLILLSFLCTF